MVTIRPYEQRDQEGVFRVCHKTGFFGSDATPHFGDRDLFGLIFASYYLEYEPESAFVACDGDAIAGYIIGSGDTLSQKETFDCIFIPRIIKRMATHTLFRHPGDVLFLLRLSVANKYDEELYSEDLIENYPAHLHINLLPLYQRRGLGGRLMQVFEDKMREKNVPGIHLVTSTENKKALPFYIKNGFSVIKELPTILWDRKSPPGTKTLVFAKRLRDT
jgi:ribosomal protein S18 acetylase RimI-like enzyme